MVLAAFSYAVGASYARHRIQRTHRYVVAGGTLLGDGATTAQTPEGPGHTPSHPAPGTPAGLGDPAAPDTAGGAGYDEHAEDGGEG